MRSLLPLFVTLTASAASAGIPGGVTIAQASDPAVTEGDVIIDGEPAANFALVQDYRKWTEIMPDVAKVEITEQKGVDARVTLVSPSGHRDNLHFHNTPQANLIFFEDTGNGGRADVWAEIVFIPNGAGTTTDPVQTRVHIKLYAKLHGVATLVVSEKDVREKREHQIAGELTHIREYFRRRVANR
ncbi:hypothetical protein BH11MYX1_BH11MYX1_23210 [soil metagenome]